jgi:hypothetical protein
VLIPSDRRRLYTTSCILHEFFHVTGFGGHSALVSGSIADADSPDLPIALSINDKILLRTLYDVRIEDGMEKARAMPIAKTIIEELVRRVNAEGERALIQRPASNL